MGRVEILATAASQEGVKESPPNSNITPYGAWFGLNGQPWCAIFVSYVYAHAGNPLGTIDYLNGYAGVPFAYKFWKKAGKFTNRPQPADIVIFDWNRDKIGDHTGIFIEWLKPGASFYTWEGNTSPTNESNGGEVMKRLRYTSQVLAFVNPLDLA